MTLPIEKTVLVIDDEEGVRLYLKTALLDAGFTVETAVDGLDALEKVQADPPDAISLDLVMPKKSGAKFLHELHRNKEWRRIPVVLVTAHAKDDLGREDFEDVMSGRSLIGPGSYLEKPVKADVYVNAIKRALGIEAAEDASTASGPRDEVDGLLEGADPEKMKRILKILREK